MPSGVDSSLSRRGISLPVDDDVAARSPRHAGHRGFKRPTAAAVASARKTAPPVTVESAANAEPPRLTASSVRDTTAAMVVSTLVHVLALLMMALIIQRAPEKERPRVIVSTPSDAVEDVEDLAIEALPDQPEQATEPVNAALALPDAVVAPEVPIATSAADLDAAPLAVELTDFSNETALPSDLLASIGAVGGKSEGLGGRSGAKRAQLVRAGGGTPQSERAVDAALAWMAAHQLPDGSWTADLAACPSCKGQCSNRENVSPLCESAGVTALGLLPFLGRGYTHIEGPYQKEVDAGLAFLAGRVVAGKGRAYTAGARGGYPQALATIALCEAYAMSKDERLRHPAQLAITFIEEAQDPVGGGWQYQPRQPGGMSSTAFHVMALKSGHMAGLTVHPAVIDKASQFIDSMEYQHAGRVQYRYSAERVNGDFFGNDFQNPTTMSARSLSNAGILCRMYLGWKKDHPAILQTIERIMADGPSTTTPYYNYYATQVVHHYGGNVWQAWNPKMRDLLISTQATQGHEAGSWQFEEDHLAGRLWCTSLSTMILEVYYRHLPIYGSRTVEDSFRE